MINKKFVSMLVLISVILLSGIGSCGTWGINSAENVNIGHEPVYLDTEDDEMWFTLTEYSGESLRLVEGYSGSVTSTMILHDEGNIRGGLVASNGYLYYVTEDGLFKRTLTSTNPLWANGEPVEAPQDNNVTVAGSTYQAPNEDMATVYTESSNVVKISSRSGIKGTLREEDGKIYYTTGTDFYSVDMENNLEQYYTGWSNGIDTFDIYDGQIYGIDLYVNGYSDSLHYTTARSTIYKDDTEIKSYSESDSHPRQFGNELIQSEFKTGCINVINPNKIYIGSNLYVEAGDTSGRSAESRIQLNNITNSTGGEVGTWSYDITGTSDGRLIDHDTVVSYKSPVFAQINYDGSNLIVANTQDAKANPTTKPVELEYDETSLSTEFDQYYNNTAIDIYWSIEGRTTQGEMTTEEFEQNYRYQIDFINPSGFKFNEYRISATKLDAGRGVLSGLIEFSGYGTVKLNPPSSDWNNGTYTARLFEVNRTTNGKSLLTQTSYEVVNESSEGGGTVEEGIEDKTGGDFFEDIIGSQYFWAMFIIVIPAVALGSIHGVSGMFIGTGTGVILTYLAGFLPLWVMLIFVMMIAIGMAMIMRDTVSSKY